MHRLPREVPRREARSVVHPLHYIPCKLIFVCVAKAGTQVIVPYRDEDEKRHLKVMGDLGQIVPMVRLAE